MKQLILASLLLAASSALAAEPPAPRTIDMTAVITDMHGKPLPDGAQASADDPRCEKCAPLTLGAVIASALLADRKDEPGVSTIEKAKRGSLAMRVIDDKAAVLNASQVADITRLLSVWSPLIIARAMPLIDPAVKLDE
jgi:hypothetical protein